MSIYYVNTVDGKYFWSDLAWHGMPKYGMVRGTMTWHGMVPRAMPYFWSHGPLFWTPRQNVVGVMGLFFGPLGKFLMIS